MDLFLSILDTAKDFLLNLAKALLMAFPMSPFANIDEHIPVGFREFLAYANYYLPFNFIFTIGYAWLFAVGTYVGLAVLIKLVNKISGSIPKPPS